MLADQELVAFVATTDLARARAFYGDTLGLRLIDENPFALVFATPGAQLRVTLVEKIAGAGYTVLGWHVPDVADAIRGLTARGVAFAQYDGVDQDDLGVWTAPGGARIAWFSDPDGNTLSLTEPPRA
jgi:catechol 2,3-dioxygenase-like lactoylglutathione lyase family enzyme